MASFIFRRLLTEISAARHEKKLLTPPEPAVFGIEKIRE